MTKEEFLDEIKKLQYSCSFGLIFNTEVTNYGITPSIYKHYNAIRGWVDLDKCIEFYKQWVKAINEEEIKKYNYHFTHEDLIKDAEERFKLEKENPGKAIYKRGDHWELCK